MLLVAKCAELQEKGKSDYESNLFAGINFQTFIKYLNCLPKDNFPSRIVNGETNEVSTSDDSEAEFLIKTSFFLRNRSGFSFLLPN